MRVSAIVPARLPAPYLSEALDSLRAQTQPLDEILLVAHGWSPDPSDPMLFSVRVLEVSSSLTFPEVLNTALREATGDVILRLDADDVALPTRVALQTAALRANPAAVAVSAAVELIEATGRPFGSLFVAPAGPIPAQRLLARNVVAHPAIMFRRDVALAVGGYGSLPLSEDYDLWLRLRAAGEIINLSESVIRYRTHAGQSTSGRRVPRAAWREIGTSRLALARVSGIPVAIAWLAHVRWCAVQALPRSVGPKRYASAWPEKTRVMLTGGLGNQLFQAAAAIDLAHGNPVELLPDLGMPRRHDGVQPDALQLNWPAAVQEVKLRGPLLVRRLAQKAAGYLLRIGVVGSAMERNGEFRRLALVAGSALISLAIGTRTRVFAAVGVGADPLVQAATGQPLLVGYFQTWRHVMAPHVLRVFRAALDGVGESWFREMAALAEREQPIVVHVRLGDYRKEPGLGLLHPEYYAAAMAEACSAQPESRIWIFSDEPDAALAMLPQHVITSGPRLVDPPSSDTHPAALLRVMSLGQRFVLGNSTFGWWAAVLSMEQPAVCVPTPWFAVGEQPLELIPASWVQRSRITGEVVS